MSIRTSVSKNGKIPHRKNKYYELSTGGTSFPNNRVYTVKKEQFWFEFVLYNTYKSPPGRVPFLGFTRLKLVGNILETRIKEWCVLIVFSQYNMNYRRKLIEKSNLFNTILGR